MERLAHRSWPELVMHVLAHVAVDVPAGLYDRTYVKWAAARLGPAANRALGEDARVLARTLGGSHAALARAQLLAWLFDEVGPASEVADRDLTDLAPEDVARPELLAPLGAGGAGVELLRCAAELERDAWERLPPVEVDEGALEEVCQAAAVAAPSLAGSKLLCLRALRQRGRVRGDEIWVGAPSKELSLSAEHVAWQAAHEATVREVHATGVKLAERRVEALALVVLAERATAAGLAGPHGRWLAHLAGPPRVARGELTPPERRLLEQLLAS